MSSEVGQAQILAQLSIQYN